uniref:Uncharacterized protein n=1 Tax=Arundo donax TaxID=35708 RepID=A0A0A9GAE2_ARUDO
MMASMASLRRPAMILSLQGKVEDGGDGDGVIELHSVEPRRWFPSSSYGSSAGLLLLSPVKRWPICFQWLRSALARDAGRWILRLHQLLESFTGGEGFGFDLIAAFLWNQSKKMNSTS